MRPETSAVRVLPATRSWPLFDVATSRVIEARGLGLHPGGALMRQAGGSVARLARALAPHATRVWVAAGPGGNGGDGLHAAACLQSAGTPVVLSLLAAPERLGDDARQGLQRARDAGVEIVDGLPSGGFDLVIDALLGLGASRAPAGPVAAAVEALNRAGSPCLAIDLPTGLHGDTGTPLGDAVVRATATLALLSLKPGLFTAAGRDHAGAIWFDALDCSLTAGTPTARLTSNEDWAAAHRARRHDQHKGSFGDVIIIGGAPGMIGAARLAAHGALGAGAGRTIVSLLDTDAAHEDASRPEWLWQHAAWLPGAAELERLTVVIGCGGGDAVRAALPAVLSRSARLVLDADALNAVATDRPLRTLLAARARRGLPTILTPHPLEAARLLGSTTTAVQSNRLAAASALARELTVIVVLKGSGTVVAAPNRIPAINSTGNPSLATGGTGDVLAGWIGGQWSQAAVNGNGNGNVVDNGDGGDLFERAWCCAVASVWLHGAAADQAGGAGSAGSASERALRAHDLVDAMRAVSALSPPTPLSALRVF